MFVFLYTSIYLHFLTLKIFLKFILYLNFSLQECLRHNIKGSTCSTTFRYQAGQRGSLDLPRELQQYVCLLCVFSLGRFFVVLCIHWAIIQCLHKILLKFCLMKNLGECGIAMPLHCHGPLRVAPFFNHNHVIYSLTLNLSNLQLLC